MKTIRNDIRVATLEDDDTYREHLAALIDGADGFACVGSYRHAKVALTQVPRVEPNVLLLDLELPGRSGLQIIEEMVARSPSLAILVLTVHDDSATIFTALEAGAVGYLSKPVSPVRLLEAIEEAHAGGSPMSASIARLVVKKFHQQGQLKRHLDQLTARETEILEHISRGLSTKEIAAQLGVSDRTIGSHLRKIYDKLQVHSRSAAVSRFLKGNA
ncbi:MAG: response regulator transcription factor [Verrucomicrobiales bacterium]|nr:response regulator transcription factor [Verrucomicrobiales bacterium]